MKNDELFKRIAAGVCAAIILLLLLMCTTVVPAGHRGVVVNFGAVQKDSLPEGMHFVPNPLAVVHDIDVRQQLLTSVGEVYTKDVQVAKVTIALSYKPNTDVAALYQEVGADYAERLIYPIISSLVREEIGRWDAVSLINERAAVTSQVSNMIADGLNKKYLNFLGLEITDIDFKDEFDSANLRKVIALQDKITAQTVAESAIITANANAQAIKIQSEALRNNNEFTKYEALAVEREAIKKWKGDLPHYVTSGTPMPFIGVK